MTDFEVFDSSTNLNDLASEHRARRDGVLELREQSMFDDLITVRQKG